MIENYANAIITRLSGDATLTGILTGGIFNTQKLTISETGYKIVTPIMRDAIGMIKPFAVVRPRAIVSTSALIDELNQYSSAEQTIEVWVFSDPKAVYSVAESAKTRIYQLMQFRPPTGAFQMSFTTVNDLRDYDFGGAHAMCIEWLIVTKTSV